jgi:hypothetical protein
MSELPDADKKLIAAEIRIAFLPGGWHGWQPDESRDDFQSILNWLGREENRLVMERYIDRLWDMVVAGRGPKTDRDCDWAIHSATPAQCVQAFLGAIKQP